MSNRIRSLLNIILVGIGVCSCQDEVSGVQVTTDKRIYKAMRDVIVTIDNNSDQGLDFYICNGRQFPTHELEKYDGQWKMVDASICNDFMSYCCGIMQAAEIKKDSLRSGWSHNGTYRLKYSFGWGENQKVFYSNLFLVE